jgi:hypothetical protein
LSYYEYYGIRPLAVIRFGTLLNADDWYCCLVFCRGARFGVLLLMDEL